MTIFEWALKTVFTVYSIFHSVCFHYFAESLNFGMKHCADLTKSMGYLLATGNLVSPTGLGLMQVYCLRANDPVHERLIFISIGLDKQKISA